MIEITDKWQCVKCKETKTQVVNTVTLDNGQKSIDPADVNLVMCHFHIMRNLTDDQYIKENEINVSGARAENPYRS